MRQISQTVRSSYDLGLEACKEILLAKLEEFKEVRCKRQGAQDGEINREFKELVLAALEFESDHFDKKLDEIQISKVPKRSDEDPAGKINQMLTEVDRTTKINKS